MHWLNLIRWKNLTIMLCMMLMAGWVLHVPFSINYALLICSVLFTAAAGNIWNDLNDERADRINKPEKMWIGIHISKIKAVVSFGCLYAVAIFFSLILYRKGFSFVLVITLIAQVLLFLYSVIFKRLPIVGNLIISILAWLSFLLIILYGKDADEISKKWVMHLGMLAFFTTWIREAVKDMQDAPGDREAQYQTLPVIWPVMYSKIYVLFLSALYLCYVIYYVLLNNYLFFYPARLLPYLLVLLVPIGWIVWMVIMATNTDEYKKTGNVIKGWMVIGILSTILWKGNVF